MLFGDSENNDASINVLEKYLISQKMDCTEIIKVFRAITKVRKGFPIHTDSDIVKGCKDLGLEYPIENYEHSWNIILDRYQSALIQIKDFLKLRQEEK
jgi:hypothetical protein